MKKFHTFIAAASLILASQGLSTPTESTNSATIQMVNPTGILLAQKKKGKKRKGAVREKRIVREERYKSKKSGDKTTLDFDSVDIGGARKTPLGSLVGQSKSNNEYDFIKIRMRWHPEMIQSASSLEAGSN